MKKTLPGQKRGPISKNLQVMAYSVKWFELFFSKMVKLDEEEC